MIKVLGVGSDSEPSPRLYMSEDRYRERHKADL